MTTEAAKLKRVIDRVESLPTLPQVLNRLEKLLQNPRTSAAEVNSLVSSDQVVTSKILKLVNSAFYGFPGQVATVTQAIVILGFNAVKSLALSASVFDMFQDRPQDTRFDRQAFWQHSISTAVITRVLARRVKYAEEEEAFVAGLLHDIGKVVLDRYVHEELVKVLDCVQHKHVYFIEAEREVMGVTHQDIGEWLAVKWQLPPQLKEAIAHHHNPMLAKKAYKLASMVHVANLLSQALGIGGAEGDDLPPLNHEAWKMLELKKTDIQPVLDQIDGDLEKAEVYFSLARPSAVVRR